MNGTKNKVLSTVAAFLAMVGAVPSAITLIVNIVNLIDIYSRHPSGEIIVYAISSLIFILFNIFTMLCAVAVIITSFATKRGAKIAWTVILGGFILSSFISFLRNIIMPLLFSEVITVWTLIPNLSGVIGCLTTVVMIVLLIISFVNEKSKILNLWFVPIIMTLLTTIINIIATMGGYIHIWQNGRIVPMAILTIIFTSVIPVVAGVVWRILLSITLMPVKETDEEVKMIEDEENTEDKK